MKRINGFEAVDCLEAMTVCGGTEMEDSARNIGRLIGRLVGTLEKLFEKRSAPRVSAVF